jgi:hypothetical protein
VREPLALGAPVSLGLTGHGVSVVSA